jgi:PTH2 family peptidyl-tRNA hydrolase
MGSEYKQVIVARWDLQMPPGKLAAQVGHAAVNASDEASLRIHKAWKENGQTKIVLRAESEAELLELYKQAQRMKLPCSLIRDEGRTVFNGVLTTTCLGIGPALSTEVHKLTGHLRLY